jgi:hypothetical protein
MIPKVKNTELGAQGVNEVNDNDADDYPYTVKGSVSPRGRSLPPSSARINDQKK